MIRLMFRGYLGRVCQWERPTSIAESDLDQVLPRLASEHGEAMNHGELTMIEVEFLDELDPNERYFRLGVSPEGMVCPIGIEIDSVKGGRS